MKILHLIHGDDSPVLLRLQERDARLLSPQFEVETWSLGDIRDRDLPSDVRRNGATLCHFYTRSLPSGAHLADLPVPWIAAVSGSRWRLFRNQRIVPSKQVSPHPVFGGDSALPEVVSHEYFEHSDREHPGPVVGGITTMETDQEYQSVRARILRFRDDVVWRNFSTVPSPREIAGIAAWVDFGVDETRDPSGVPEALVAGRAVIAPRSDIHRARLLEGDAGFLVPKGDPNEMAHVILTALFKPEVTALRIASALNSRDRFRPEKRLAALQEIYRAVGIRSATTTSS